MHLTALILVAHVIVEAPCSLTPWLDVHEPAAAGTSVGALTLDILTRHDVSFAGTADGIHSIRGTVTGDHALEVVSDRELRAYGWCYSLNDVEPGDLPSAVTIAGDDDVVRWSFGFARYKDGEWVSYCEKTNVVRPAYICG